MNYYIFLHIPGTYFFNLAPHPSDMSSVEPTKPTIDQILPDFGKLFYEQKSDFVFCKPHLMPLKSITLLKLENMQKEAHKQLQETRAKTAATEMQ